MSFMNKPGKTSAWRKMVIRQQVSDVIAYNEVITTITKAKETKKHVDKMITLGKKNNLAAKQKMRSILLKTQKMDVEQLIEKLTGPLAKKYEKRIGGYCRVLRLGARKGDRTEEAIIQLV